MDIPNEIIPKPDYDVPSDLLIFMRNDPTFYRKNFFPAIDKYKEDTKDTSPIENMIKRGLGSYCQKFQIETPQDELMGEGDIQDLVRQIIADEMEELSEGWMDNFKNNMAASLDSVKSVGNAVAGIVDSDPLFRAWKQKMKKSEQEALQYLMQDDPKTARQKHKEFKTKYNGY